MTHALGHSERPGKGKDSRLLGEVQLPVLGLGNPGTVPVPGMRDKELEVY